MQECCEQHNKINWKDSQESIAIEIPSIFISICQDFLHVEARDYKKEFNRRISADAREPVPAKYMCEED
jgi:hypothetical protein